MGNSGYKVPRTDWCFGKIYASDISAKILIARFPHLRAFTVALDLMTKYEIKGRQVWLIPANHCPGAVMFLVRSQNGRQILHTGDFRYRPEMLEEIQKCSPEKPLKIDFLYMDNTFGTAEEYFPNQQVAYH